jgi:urea carboxylase-associated protein 2
MVSEIARERVIYSEPLRGGQTWSRIIRRGQVLRLVDTQGGANPAGLFYNAAAPLERYDMPGTLKAQHTARLTAGYCIYSDMGRVLLSVIDDTSGWHDTITGGLDARGSERRFGLGSYQKLRNGFYRNTRDNFLVELGKHGLGKQDITPNVNFFAKIVVEDDGALDWEPNARPGAYVDLRAEMDVLVVLSNTPHPLDPVRVYSPKPIELTVWQGDAVSDDDTYRAKRPENERGFTLTAAYSGCQH